MQYVKRETARRMFDETRTEASKELVVFSGDVCRTMGDSLDTGIHHVLVAQAEISLSKSCDDYLSSVKRSDDGVAIKVEVVDVVEYLLQEILRLGRSLANKGSNQFSNLMIEYRIQACAMFVYALIIGGFEIKES